MIGDRVSLIKKTLLFQRCFVSVIFYYKEPVSLFSDVLSSRHSGNVMPACVLILKVALMHLGPKCEDGFTRQFKETLLR